MASQYGRKVLLGFFAFFATYFLTVLILGKERPHKLQPSEFISLYQKKPYQSLVSKIAQEKYVIIEGLVEDGVDEFVDYLLNITLSEQHTVNHRVFSNATEIEDDSYPHFSSVRSALVDNLAGAGANKVWIIDSDVPLTQTHLKVAFALASAGKDDRIILITPESNVKNKLFKKVTYTRPTDSSIETLLKSQGLSEYQVTTVLENHQNNLHTISQALDEKTLLDYEKAYQTEKETITQQLKGANKKITTNLNKLCKTGTLSSKNEIDELKLLVFIVHIDGNYYWASNRYLQAYQSIISQDCQQPAQFASQVEVQQPEVVQVPVVVEQPVVVVEQPKQKKVKENKKANQKQTKAKPKAEAETKTKTETKTKSQAKPLTKAQSKAQTKPKKK